MGADDWRYEYLSEQLRDYKGRLETAEKMVNQAKAELIASEWQRDKFKTIVEMLDVAYKVNVTSCAQRVESKVKTNNEET
jgi:hypothetical protein